MRRCAWILVIAWGIGCGGAPGHSHDDAGLDAATPADAGMDAAPGDGGIDASARDGGIDASTRDAGSDASRDGGRDAAPRDAGTDAPFVSGCSSSLSIGLYGADMEMQHQNVRNYLIGTGMFTSGGVVIGGPLTTSSTPTLDELLRYDAVFIWGSGSWDGDAVGNVLADYVDAGRGVVIAVFGQRTDPLVGVYGRMESAGYLPYVPGSYEFADLSLGTIAMPTHPIMNGVSSVGGSSVAFHMGSIASGATLIASFSNDAPLVATLEVSAGRTALLGFYPAGLWDTSTDGALLMANTLRWVACGD